MRLTAEAGPGLYLTQLNEVNREELGLVSPTPGGDPTDCGLHSRPHGRLGGSTFMQSGKMVACKTEQSP